MWKDHIWGFCHFTDFVRYLIFFDKIFPFYRYLELTSKWGSNRSKNGHFWPFSEGPRPSVSQIIPPFRGSNTYKHLDFQTVKMTVKYLYATIKNGQKKDLFWSFFESHPCEMRYIFRYFFGQNWPFSRISKNLERKSA